jgi:aspartate racemase
MNKSEGKILGIIGGMGPLATNIFYKMLIDMTPAHRDQDHINMIILSHATMPDRTQAIESGNLSVLLSKLQEDAVFLEKSGADCIAIPCNTSHVVMDDIQKVVSIPIVNMVRETVSALIDEYGCQNQRVGIMATDGTIEAEMFQKEMIKRGLIPIVPNKVNQNKVMHIIYDGVKAGIPVEPDDFDQVENQLREEGCKKIVLACTELSCYAMENQLSDIYVDAMEILARKVISICKS